MEEMPVSLRSSGNIMVVCVPKEWSNSQIEEFANGQNSGGKKWKFVLSEDELDGVLQRMACGSSGRTSFVHVRLVAVSFGVIWPIMIG